MSSSNKEADTIKPIPITASNIVGMIYMDGSYLNNKYGAKASAAKKQPNESDLADLREVSKNPSAISLLFLRLLFPQLVHRKVLQ